MTVETDAFTAVTRFGLGPNARDLKQASSDPRGWVSAQLTAPIVVPGAGDPGLTRDVIGQRTLELLSARRTALRDEKHGRGRPGEVKQALKTFSDFVHSRFLDEIDLRVGSGVATATPLQERLVLFWTNHFSVSIKGGLIGALLGNYEREAIRPNILGSFTDLLVAAELHPVMLSYLDNIASIGPDSRAGRRTHRGINENLGREILELHTVGVDGGYTQADVIAFAKVLTGWVGGVQPGPIKSPHLRSPFLPAWHDPGPKTIMGTSYPDTGADQAVAVLCDLANKPATAAHLAGKLVRHFVGDAAPETLVRRVKDAFIGSQGNLTEVTRALVTADEAWSFAPSKVLPPYDLIVAASRALQAAPKPQFVANATRAMGQPIWRAAQPVGWPDGDMSWAGGDSLLERVDWAHIFMRRFGHAAETDVRAEARAQLGPAYDRELDTTLARAESREQALTLLLMSPQWQRR